jgi:hypothetical protein
VVVAEQAFVPQLLAKEFFMPVAAPEALIIILKHKVAQAEEVVQV